MQTLKNLWNNLSKAQRIGIIVFIQGLIIITLVLLLNPLSQPKPRIAIQNETATKDIPDKNMKIFKETLWSTISNNIEGLDRSILDDVVIREDTIEITKTDEGYRATFLLDIDSIEQTYRGHVSWITNPNSDFYDSASIECPTSSETKYPNSKCYGSNDDAESFNHYFPYIVTTDPDEKARDIFIVGDEHNRIITVQLVVCDNPEELKQQAADYINNIPIDLSDYTIEYDISSVDANCEEGR